MINLSVQSPYLNYAGEELSAVSRRDGSKCFKRLIHLNIQQMSRDIYSGTGSQFSSPSSFFFIFSALPIDWQVRTRQEGCRAGAENRG